MCFKWIDRCWLSRWEDLSPELQRSVYMGGAIPNPWPNHISIHSATGKYNLDDGGTYEDTLDILLKQIEGFNRDERKVFKTILMLNCRYQHGKHLENIKDILDEKLKDVPELTKNVKQLIKDFYGNKRI